MILRKVLLLVACHVGLTVAAVAEAYSIVDLGPGTAQAINSAGSVVGQNAIGHAFLFSNGVQTDLGTLGGATSVANALNDNEDIVGTAKTADGGDAAFLFRNGVMYQIGGDSSAWAYEATGINDAGQIVGRGLFAGQGTAFVFDSGLLTPFLGMPTDVPLHPPIGTVSGISANGTMVGLVQSGSFWTAYYFQSGQLFEVNGLGGSLSEFRAINSNGESTGGSNLTGDQWSHAILYTGGIVTDLGTPDGTGSTIGLAINSGGDVVGQWFPPNGAVSHAVLYRAGQMVDLNSLVSPVSGWILESATGINDRGEIVGYGQFEGLRHAYVLTVPEPTTGILASVALAGILVVLVWRAVDWSEIRKVFSMC